MKTGRRHAVSGAVAMAAFGSQAGRSHAQTRLRDIAISLPSRSLVATSPLLAKEMGLFEAQGLNPRFTTMDSANGSTTALISRSVDAAMSGSAEIVAAQARGQKVVLIVSTYTGLSGSLVLSSVVASKLGIAAAAPIGERLRALDGLLIASTSATSSFTISYGAASKAVGANVRFTYMALPAMMAAMEAGAVQGFVATPPYYAVPVLKGSGVLWISAPNGELPYELVPASSANLQMLRGNIDSDPSLMKALVAAMSAYGRALVERPDTVKAAISKLYPEIDAKTLDYLFALESPAWKPRELTVADMRHEIEYVSKSGLPLPASIGAVEPAAMLP